jgi:uncharacterized protein YbaR (Trm112 family)
MNDKIIVACPECSKKMRIPKGKHIKLTCPNCNQELEYDDTPKEAKELLEDAENNSSYGNGIIVLISYILFLPIYLILYKLIPDLDWVLNLDRILLIALTLGLLKFFLKKMRVIVLLGFFVSLSWLTYGSFTGKYGYGDLYRDYISMLYAIKDSPNPQNIIISKLKPFKNKTEIKRAIDYDNSEVRNFALSATREHFMHYQNRKKYRTLVQCFAVFKEINSKWNYVSDPRSKEYFAKASESILHLSGDCDDHSILMVSCIKAIGGTARLVHTEGHLYPEVLIGTRKDLERINYIIKRKLFRRESSGKDLNYHKDENGQVWLNLDYTAKYPGGPFLKNKILGTLTIDW